MGYLSDTLVKEANEYNKVTGAYIKILDQFGVAGYPKNSSALFFHFCRVNNLNINTNLSQNVIWLDEWKLQDIVKNN